MTKIDSKPPPPTATDHHAPYLSPYRLAFKSIRPVSNPFDAYVVFPCDKDGTPLTETSLTPHGHPTVTDCRNNLGTLYEPPELWRLAASGIEGIAQLVERRFL